MFDSVDWAITWKLLSDSYPVMVSSLCTFGIIDFVLFFFVGQLDVPNTIDVFAGVSLAQMFGNVTCLSLLWGLASAVETLASQANGAGNLREVGVVVHRSVILVGMSAIPLAFLWLSAPTLFHHFGIHKDVCRIVNTCLVIRLFELPGNVLICSLECFLTAVGVTTPLLYSNVALNVAFAVLCFASVYILDYSYVGIAWAHVAATYVCLVVEVVLSVRYDLVRQIILEQRLHWREVLGDVKACATFMWLGFYGAVMLCCEWWAYELLTLMAGFLGTPQVAAQSIIFATINIIFSVPYGIGAMVASGIGNHLGRGEIERARRLCLVAFCFVGVAEVVLALGVHLFSTQYLHLFTSDPAVLEITMNAIPLVNFLVVCDGLQTTGSSVLKGAGRQELGAVINFASFYAIGMPLSWYCCFRMNYGVTGLVFGMACANLLQVVLHALMFYVASDYIFVHDATLLIDDPCVGELVDGYPAGCTPVGINSVPYTILSSIAEEELELTSC